MTIRNTLYIFLLLTFPFILNSCREDDLWDNADYGLPNGAIPIDIKCLLPDVATRSIVNPKSEFVVGDVIHIEGCFKMQNDDNDNPVEDLYLYGAFQYSAEGKWIPLSDNENSEVAARIYWPNKSVSASFKSYYISSREDADMLSPGTETRTYSLSSLSGYKDPLDKQNNKEDKDPLVAQTSTVAYGHTIQLNFEHACAFLTIEELPYGVSPNDVFWIMREKGANNIDDTFNNAFKLTLSEDNKLSLVFVQQKDENYSDAIYVAGEAEDFDTAEGLRNSVGFYLEPGHYDSFVIAYPEGDRMKRYFTFNSEEVEEKPDRNLLLKNNRYIFNVTRSSGIDIENDPNLNNWDETDDLVRLEPIEVEQFLWAISQGEDYSNMEGTAILEKTSVGSRLIKNVDFQFYRYNVFDPEPGLHEDWFLPNVDKVFDGGLHYIWNIGCPLFINNSGTIRNVGIRNAQVEAYSALHFYPETGGNDSFNFSRIGAVCGYNSGTLDNLRIRDLNMTVYVNPSQELDSEGHPMAAGEIHAIGGIVGSVGDHGIINSVSINGNFILNILNAPLKEDPGSESPETPGGGDENTGGDNGDDNTGTRDDSGNGNENQWFPSRGFYTPEVDAGAIAGNNSNLIQNISVLDNVLNVEIRFKCEGETGAYYIGGLVGNNTGGYIDTAIIPSLTVRTVNSFGNNLYLGGIAGRLSSSNATSAVNSCIIKGAISTGVTEKYGTTDSFSFVGGMAGQVSTNVSVDNCRSIMDITGAQQKFISDNVNYGIGGIFGYILSSNSSRASFYDLIDTGSSLSVNYSLTNVYAGDFAGVCSVGDSWENYMNSDLNIQNFEENRIKEIGANYNSSSKTFTKF
ncbi:MAG: fimbrillin family protein [Muribaculaceae bacterium]|nr:fimbrillin family protein [Muribaculaceae bacterium]